MESRNLDRTRPVRDLCDHGFDKGPETAAVREDRGAAASRRGDRAAGECFGGEGYHHSLPSERDRQVPADRGFQPGLWRHRARPEG